METTRITIASELAHYLGPNLVDYQPLDFMVGEYILRFGFVDMDDVPEVGFTRFLQDCELERDWIR